MNGLQFLQLLHIADSALPVGAAAHSLGLEGLVAENHLEVQDLFDFFSSYLHEAGRLDAVFVYAGYEAASLHRWQQLNQQMSAMKSARETREAGLRLGKRFAGLAAEAFAIEPQFTAAPVHLPLIFGHVGRRLAAPAEQVVAAFLHQSLSGMVSACQRLLPLGQSTAATLLWRLKPVMLEAVAIARASQVEEAYLSQPLLDLASARHPGLHTRLFIS